MSVRYLIHTAIWALALVVCTAGCGGGGGAGEDKTPTPPATTGKIESAVAVGGDGSIAAAVEGTAGDAVGGITITVPNGAKTLSVVTEDTGVLTRGSSELKFELSREADTAGPIVGMTNGQPSADRLAAVPDASALSDSVDAAMRTTLGVNPDDGLSEAEVDAMFDAANTLSSDALPTGVRAQVDAYWVAMPENSGHISRSRDGVTETSVVSVYKPTPGKWTVRAESSSRSTGFRAAVVVSAFEGLDVAEVAPALAQAEDAVAGTLGRARSESRGSLRDLLKKFMVKAMSDFSQRASTGAKPSTGPAAGYFNARPSASSDFRYTGLIWAFLKARSSFGTTYASDKLRARL